MRGRPPSGSIAGSRFAARPRWRVTPSFKQK